MFIEGEEGVGIRGGWRDRWTMSFASENWELRMGRAVVAGWIEGLCR
jgi:hypothetical protein